SALVGASWLAILVFGLLALAQGVAVASFAARWSQTQPLLTTWRAVPRYLPLVPFLLFGTAGVVMIVAVLLSVFVVRIGRDAGNRQRIVDAAGRVVLLGIVVLAVPGFL